MRAFPVRLVWRIEAIRGDMVDVDLTVVDSDGKTLVNYGRVSVKAGGLTCLSPAYMVPHLTAAICTMTVGLVLDPESMELTVQEAPLSNVPE